MIVTLIPSPDLEHAVDADALRRGEVLRAAPAGLGMVAA